MFKKNLSRRSSSVAETELGGSSPTSVFGISELTLTGINTVCENSALYVVLACWWFSVLHLIFNLA